MRKQLLAITAGLGLAASSLFAGQAQAVPTCGPINTGTPVGGDTNVVVSGTVIQGSILGVTNTCVQAGDKIFGNFAGTGGTGFAAASFIFGPGFGNVTMGITDAIGASSTATLDYQVAITPAALALGWRINDLEKDLTLNQAGTGLPASATLTGSSPDHPFISAIGGNLFVNATISCTRHDPAGIDTCPVEGFFTTGQGVPSVAIHEEVTTGVNTIVTGLTDTVTQVVPEPASLALLGTGVIGLGLLRRRR